MQRKDFRKLHRLTRIRQPFFIVLGLMACTSSPRNSESTVVESEGNQINSKITANQSTDFSNSIGAWINESYYNEMVEVFNNKPSSSSFKSLKDELRTCCHGLWNVTIEYDEELEEFSLYTLNSMDRLLARGKLNNPDTLFLQSEYDQDDYKIYFDTGGRSIIANGHKLIPRTFVFMEALEGDYTVFDNSGSFIDSLTIYRDGSTNSRIISEVRLLDYDMIDIEYFVDPIEKYADLAFVSPNDLYYELVRTEHGFHLYHSRTHWDFVSIDEEPDYRLVKGLHYVFKRVNLAHSQHNITATTQQISYESYDRISNPDFQAFVDLFDRHPLPISTSDLFDSKILDPENRKPNLQDDLVDSFLKKDGEHIPTPAFINENESGSQDTIYGNFYPLYYLPTNGDYVLLAILRDHPSGDTNKDVWVYAYDLSGNFIYTAAWLVSDGAPYLSGELNTQLQFKYIYTDDFEGEYSTCNPCNQNVYTVIYQTEGVGTQVELSFTSEMKQIRFISHQDRFVLVE